MAKEKKVKVEEKIKKVPVKPSSPPMLNDQGKPITCAADVT